METMTGNMYESYSDTSVWKHYIDTERQSMGTGGCLIQYTDVEDNFLQYVAKPHLDSKFVYKYHMFVIFFRTFIKGCLLYYNAAQVM